MARFIFELPNELADKVEAYRAQRALKATAEAVRELLTKGIVHSVMLEPAATATSTIRRSASPVGRS
jgi:hypothetical protein